MESFAKFEDKGRQRVAGEYDPVWLVCAPPELLARPALARFQAIQSAIQESFRGYGFAVLTTAYVIVLGRKGVIEKEERTRQRRAK